VYTHFSLPASRSAESQMGIPNGTFSFPNAVWAIYTAFRLNGDGKRGLALTCRLAARSDGALRARGGASTCLRRDALVSSLAAPARTKGADRRLLTRVGRFSRPSGLGRPCRWARPCIDRSKNRQTSTSIATSGKRKRHFARYAHLLGESWGQRERTNVCLATAASLQISRDYGGDARPAAPRLPASDDVFTAALGGAEAGPSDCHLSVSGLQPILAA
jgi:hypothetical protein